MNKYEVGDVIWVVRSDRPGLTVLQVVEQVTTKSLDGTKTSYTVRLPGKPSLDKMYDLEDVQGDFYSSSDQAKAAMMKAAEDTITQMVDKVSSLSNKWFKKELASPSVEAQPEIVSQPLPEKDQTDDGFTFITLENGTRARVKMPEEF